MTTNLPKNMEGALWMLGSACAATVMSVGIKEIGTGSDIHTMQITFMRCLVGFMIVVPMVWGGYLHRRSRQDARQEARERSPFRLSARWKLHVLRGLLATVAINCGYYSLTVIPLATVTVIFFTAPLFVTLLAVPMLGEKVGWRRWSATGLGLCGVVLAIDPQAGSFEPVMLIPIVSSVMFAFALVVGKKLSATEAPSSILLYTTAVTTVGSALPAFFVWVTPSWSELWFLVAVALFATARTYSDVRAYAAGEASFVAPFSYLRLILMSAAGYLIFAEVPGLMVVLGAVLIIVSTLYIAHREIHHNRRISKPAAGPSPD